MHINQRRALVAFAHNSGALSDSSLKLFYVHYLLQRFLAPRDLRRSLRLCFVLPRCSSSFAVLCISLPALVNSTADFNRLLLLTSSLAAFLLCRFRCFFLHSLLLFPLVPLPVFANFDAATHLPSLSYSSSDCDCILQLSLAAALFLRCRTLLPRLFLRSTCDSFLPLISSLTTPLLRHEEEMSLNMRCFRKDSMLIFYRL